MGIPRRRESARRTERDGRRTGSSTLRPFRLRPGGAGRRSGSPRLARFVGATPAFVGNRQRSGSRPRRVPRVPGDVEDTRERETPGEPSWPLTQLRTLRLRPCPRASRASATVTEQWQPKIRALNLTVDSSILRCAAVRRRAPRRSGRCCMAPKKWTEIEHFLNWKPACSWRHSSGSGRKCEPFSVDTRLYAATHSN